MGGEAQFAYPKNDLGDRLPRGLPIDVEEDLCLRFILRQNSNLILTGYLLLDGGYVGHRVFLKLSQPLEPACLRNAQIDLLDLLLAADGRGFRIGLELHEMDLCVKERRSRDGQRRKERQHQKKKVDHRRKIKRVGWLEFVVGNELQESLLVLSVFGLNQSAQRHRFGLCKAQSFHYAIL